MKYINDLSYSSHVAQTKHIAKDKKQKNKYRQIALLEDDTSEEDLSAEQQEITPEINEDNERRTGEDRRKNQENRGRYVESRLEKNRRYRKELSLKV